MIYLDNAATTFKKPIATKKYVNKALDEFSNPNRGMYKSSYESGLQIYNTRSALATLFNANPNHVIFTLNATQSLNYAIFSICKQNDKVAITNIEHNSVVRPLLNINADITYIDVLGCSLDDTLQSLEQALKAGVSAFICSHSSNVTGQTLPVSEFSKLCKRYNTPFILDVAQSAGVLDCDIEVLGADILCFTGHKSLYGPMGIGGLVFSTRFVENFDLKPFITGGNGLDTFNQNVKNITFPDSFEAGTQNILGISGLYGGLRYIETRSVDSIYDKVHHLAKTFYDGIKDLPNVKLYSKCNLGDTPVISLNIGNVSSIDIGELLVTKYNIATRHGFHCSPLVHEHFKTKKQGMVRFSFCDMNTDFEVESAIIAIRELSEIVD